MHVSIVSASSNREDAQNTLEYPLVSSYKPLTFSYFFNSTSNSLNLFTAQIDNNTVTLMNFMIMDNYPGTYGMFPQIEMNITNWNNSDSSFTYFNSGQHSFFIVGLNNSFEIFVDSLNASNSFHLSGDYKFFPSTSFLDLVTYFLPFIMLLLSR